MADFSVAKSLVVLAGLVMLAAKPVSADDTMLLNFKSQADLAHWSPVAVVEAPRPKPTTQPATATSPAQGPALPPALGAKPDTGPSAATIELADQNATSGQKCLKITFHGGQWPGVVNAKLPIGGNWQEYNSIKLDLTTAKPALAGLRITQRKSPDDPGMVWERTIYLVPGKNDVLLYLKHPEDWGPIGGKYGDVTSLVIYAYRPAEGDALYVDNVRLSTDKPPRSYFRDPLWNPFCWHGHSMFNNLQFARTGKLAEFPVAGTDMVVADCAALAAKLKDKWTAPQAKTIDQVEAEFQEKYAEIKKEHPKAVAAVFRDGEKGFDPADPEKAYAGWKDAHLDCHEPDGPLAGRENNSGKNDPVEAFMRHRALIAQADLSAIPKGAKILSAQLVLNRTPQSRDATKMPTMYVAEPCMRPWEEYQVNCYQYADGRLWKAISGCYYGEDPDFLPIFLAYGPGQGPANVWDFTEAVKFWTDGAHENHGFIFHGDSQDYVLLYSREHKEIKLRPAIMVIYEPQ